MKFTLIVMGVCLLTITLAAAFGATHPSMNSGGFAFAFRNLVGGSMVPLSRYAGDVMLVVNTAARCDDTQELEELEGLYQDYKQRGLIVIAVPSDDFQSESERSALVSISCLANSGITFPLMAQEHVLGKWAHGFYLWAEAQTSRKSERRPEGKRGFGDARSDGSETAAPSDMTTLSGDFHKYVVGRDGALVASISNAGGGAKHLRSVLETALGASTARATDH